MIVLNAIIEVKEGQNLEFEKDFLKLQAKVLKDPGAIAYAMHRSLNNPCKFFVYEKYQDEKAIEYHTSTPHFKAFFGKFTPAFKSEPMIEMYQEVTGK